MPDNPKTTIEIEGKDSGAARALDVIDARLKKINEDAKKATQSIAASTASTDAMTNAVIRKRVDNRGPAAGAVPYDGTKQNKRGSLIDPEIGNPTGFIGPREKASVWLDRKNATKAATEDSAQKKKLEIQNALAQAANLEANGQFKAGEAARDKAKAMALAMQIQRQTKVSDAEAMNLATYRVAAEKEAGVAKKEQAEITRQETSERKKQESIANRVRSNLNGMAARMAGAGRMGGLISAGESMFGLSAGAGIGIAGLAGAGVAIDRFQKEDNHNRIANENELRRIDNMRRSMAGASGDSHAANAAKLVDEIIMNQQALDEATGRNDGWIGKAGHGIAQGARKVWNVISHPFSPSRIHDGTDIEKQDRSAEQQRQMREQKNRDIAESIRLGQAEVDIARLESVGLQSQAIKLQRKVELNQKLAEINANKGMSDQEKGARMTQEIELDRLKHILAPQIGIGDSLAAAGGGGGVFQPGGGVNADPALDQNNTLLAKLNELMQDFINTLPSIGGSKLQIQRN